MYGISFTCLRASQYKIRAGTSSEKMIILSPIKKGRGKGEGDRGYEGKGKGNMKGKGRGV